MMEVPVSIRHGKSAKRCREDKKVDLPISPVRVTWRNWNPISPRTRSGEIGRRSYSDFDSDSVGLGGLIRDWKEKNRKETRKTPIPIPISARVSIGLMCREIDPTSFQKLSGVEVVISRYH